MPHRAYKRLLLGSLILTPLVFSGCGSEAPRQEITESAPATPEDQAVRDVTTPERMRVAPGQRGPADIPPMSSQQEEPAPAYHWDVPAGWEEIEPTPLRVANLQVAGNPEAECYFTVLAGDGGGLVENINRWYKQMNQPALSEDEVAALPEKELLGAQAKYIVIDGAFSGMQGGPGKEGYRLVGLALVKDGEASFVKMTGPASVLESEMGKFEEFAASIHPDDHEHEHAPQAEAHPPMEPSPAAPAAPAPGGSGLDVASLKWNAPETWSRAADRPMRLVTYVVGTSECYITVLPGTAGGVESNLNRWQEQMGQAALSPEQLSALPKMNMLGQQVPLLTATGHFTDMQGRTHENQMLLGTVCTLDGQTLFVKMTGPESEISAEVDNFRAFCESIHQ